MTQAGLSLALYPRLDLILILPPPPPETDSQIAPHLAPSLTGAACWHLSLKDSMIFRWGKEGHYS